jgi:ubiquinone/menaquinone biosynthesis C-methylase UbiE
MDAAHDRTAQAEGRKPVSAWAPCVTPEVVSVADGYRRWARTYDGSPNPLLAREERYLAPILSRLRKTQLLDLGCGTGRWLERLAPELPLAVGLDLSHAMLQVASRKAAIRHLLVESRGELLPFRSSVFDLVICSFALAHLHDLHPLAIELSRVARPGADLFITDVHLSAHDAGWRAGFRHAKRALQIETFRHSFREIVGTFRAGGFECLERVPLWLAEPERPIFVRAGKSDLFEHACTIPALVNFHFTKLEQAISPIPESTQ